MKPVVAEHEHRRNGLYSPDAKNVSKADSYAVVSKVTYPLVFLQKFAFGKSKKLNEHQVSVRLRFLMKILSREQPLVLLFHNAAAEKEYFKQMDIDIDDLPERVSRALLEDFRDGKAQRGEKRAETLILDTQRLYKSFTHCTPDAYNDQQISLGKMAKRLGIVPKYLHNAGQSIDPHL